MKKLQDIDLIEVLNRTEEITDILIKETILYRKLLMLSLEHVPNNLKLIIKRATQI